MLLFIRPFGDLAQTTRRDSRTGSIVAQPKILLSTINFSHKSQKLCANTNHELDDRTSLHFLVQLASVNISTSLQNGSLEKLSPGSRQITSVERKCLTNGANSVLLAHYSFRYHSLSQTGIPGSVSLPPVHLIHLCGVECRTSETRTPTQRHGTQVPSSHSFFLGWMVCDPCRTHERPLFLLHSSSLSSNQGLDTSFGQHYLPRTSRLDASIDIS